MVRPGKKGLLRMRPPGCVVAIFVAALALRCTEAFREDLNISVAQPPVDLDTPGAPRNVHCTVSVNKIGSIDALSSTFKFDFYIYVTWRDDRLGTDSDSTEGDIPIDGTVWWPQPEIMNFHEGVKGEWQCAFSAGAPRFVKTDTAEESEGTWALCQTRHQPVLDAELLLLDFPFDRQNADIIIESFLWGAAYMKYVPASSLKKGLLPPLPPPIPTRRRADVPTPSAGSSSTTDAKNREGTGSAGENIFAVPGWKIMGTEIRVIDQDYPMFGEKYSRLLLTLNLQRLPDYYISRYVWGVAFLVAMCFLTLCVPSEEADRFGMAQGSFLCIVSWEFILVTSAPPTAYNTRLDDFMITSLACTFITCFWNAVCTRLLCIRVHSGVLLPFPATSGCRGLHR